MANTLLENYKGRLALADKAYAQTHGGEKLTEQKKLVTARCLENVSKFLNESFENSVGTQRADLGLYKKFSLNLTNVAVPNLIAYDLVLVQPLASMSGYLSYLAFSYGSNKGSVEQGTIINDPFRLGNYDQNYTSAKVITEAKAATTDAGVASGSLNWKPVLKGQVEFIVGAVTILDGGDGKLYQGREIDKSVSVLPNGNVVPGAVITEGTEVGTIDYATGAYSFTAAGIVAVTPVFANYIYDNVVIPQNDLPILNAEMKAIPLIAKPRRIAIYYSQIAAFQAKTDYGFDLGAELSKQAVGTLSFEIDTEIVDLLVKNAAEDTDLTWSKTLPYGVSKAEHYQGFLEMIGIAKEKIYNKTKRHEPTFMLVAPDVVPVLEFINELKEAPATEHNGPYFLGTLAGLKVFVSPNIERGRYAFGVNKGALEATAAVYAPYMPIVPTQALQYADGGNSQGFSTLYALELLNKDLLISGRITA